MLKYFLLYLAFLVALASIDLVWLLGIAKNVYRDEMGSLMATEPKLLAGLAFYVLYALGALIFVVIPALSKQSLSHALLYGALFGFFCYMTYDLTNLAVIRDFPSRLAFIDIAWGSLVTAGVSGLIYKLGEWAK
ncbi:DUF2177 domain-containing protein [Polynucleobacter paneuropaeus]|uniref:DUF2177 domain-containing protein n=1 Tax=Polynucleobacter paneuropaeus TaxID=2527775 RepID=A0A2Z4JRK4_9BURK|nr:DUF2177 family protein [Polynucleobacter paneuropaeus]AWW49289.1 DUF2177 domain-containing protein [Polynucleobacter paneuropaeus]MBT8622838.1 DUF2177 family protein [Polynucleobacter paneuropaeus]